MSDSEGSSSSSSSSETDRVTSPTRDTRPSRNRKRKAPDRSDKCTKSKKSKSELRKFAQHCFEQFAARSSFHNYPPFHPPEFEQKNDDEVSLNVSGELFSDNESTVPSSFQLPIRTVLKEPAISKSSKDHIELLNSIQHLNCPEWCDVRYSEVQKNYCSTPGFVELECNDEIKPFDKLPNLMVAERSYAALTQALIKQRESAQAGFASLLSWASSTDELSPLSLKDKINEIFIEGNYNKISSDILQLCCGHRADIIEQRRDGVLRYVKDKFIRSNLRKIPPTSESLFSKESFSTTLEKSGGVSKIFWPIRNAAQKSNWAAAQAGPSNTKPPAQGGQDLNNKGLYGRHSYTQPAQGAYSDFYPTQAGRFPVVMYPPQGFGYPYQGNNPTKRFTQNHSRNRSTRPENRPFQQRQPAQYDDGQGKNMRQQITKNFRSKRKP